MITRGGSTNRRWALGSLACLLILWIAGCSGGDVKRAECHYAYEKGAITLHLTAAPDLNRYDGQPHTVVVSVYQLSNPNVFSQSMETPEGLSTLMQGERFDESVLSPRQVILQPGESETVTLDRVEGARYVGVVGGFFNRNADQVSRLYEVPTKKITSLFGKEKDCIVKSMEVGLNLGAKGIVTP